MNFNIFKPKPMPVPQRPNIRKDCKIDVRHKRDGTISFRTNGACSKEEIHAFMENQRLNSNVEEYDEREIKD